jgi:hypothetical protein
MLAAIKLAANDIHILYNVHSTHYTNFLTASPEIGSIIRNKYIHFTKNGMTKVITNVDFSISQNMKLYAKLKFISQKKISKFRKKVCYQKSNVKLLPNFLNLAS